MELGGAYTAERAAALSGVPKSTLHYWARQAYLVPSVSAERVKLWSFADLMALRTIYWLRQPKSAEGREIPRSKMRVIKHAIARLRELDLDLFEGARPNVSITLEGDVVLDRVGAALEALDGQLVEREVIDVLAPFATLEGARGPDLSMPRPQLRIVPRKLSGAPHVVDTRVETQAIQALAMRGYSVAKIAQLYPFLGEQEIMQSIELELQLASNAALRAA
jgi:uncharacterized protein (DUF433 family)